MLCTIQATSATLHIEITSFSWETPSVIFVWQTGQPSAATYFALDFSTTRLVYWVHNYVHMRIGCACVLVISDVLTRVSHLCPFFHLLLYRKHQMFWTLKMDTSNSSTEMQVVIVSYVRVLSCVHFLKDCRPSCLMVVW